jgi:hypothetical protein
VHHARERRFKPAEIWITLQSEAVAVKYAMQLLVFLGRSKIFSKGFARLLVDLFLAYPVARNETANLILDPSPSPRCNSEAVRIFFDARAETGSSRQLATVLASPSIACTRGFRFMSILPPQCRAARALLDMDHRLEIDLHQSENAVLCVTDQLGERVEINRGGLAS